MNAAQATVSAALAAADALLNSGMLTIYSGTMPTSPETALSGNTALVTFTFAASAFAAPTYSSPNMQSVGSFTETTESPLASGTATFARAYKSDGTTAVADYTVTATGGGGDITLGNTGIQTGVPVTLNSITHKMPAV